MAVLREDDRKRCFLECTVQFLDLRYRCCHHLREEGLHVYDEQGGRHDDQVPLLTSAQDCTDPLDGKDMRLTRDGKLELRLAKDHDTQRHIGSKLQYRIKLSIDSIA